MRPDRLLLLAVPALMLPVAAAAQAGIVLLEPIGGVTEIPTQNNNGFGVFFTYFNLLYPWVLGMGNDAGRQAGIKRLLMSLGGLLLLLFSSTLLNILNPSFFK